MKIQVVCACIFDGNTARNMIRNTARNTIRNTACNTIRNTARNTVGNTYKIQPNIVGNTFIYCLMYIHVFHAEIHAYTCIY
jgi:hypothetical protein